MAGDELWLDSGMLNDEDIIEGAEGVVFNVKVIEKAPDFNDMIVYNGDGKFQRV